jgi:hypothetical protein
MATSYIWTVTKMYTLQQPDPNYVVNAFYVVTGTDGTYTGSVEGDSQFSSAQSTTFIPYDQLTNDIVVGWIKAKLGEGGVANFENSVQGVIDYKKNPPVAAEVTPLPWA